MTVYAVQNPMRMNKVTGALEPRFDRLDRAAHFGQIRFLLSPSAGPWRCESILRDLKKELATFCDDDYLLLIGNPILIGLATAIAAQVNGGYIQFLQWSGKDDGYVSVEAQGIDLDDEPESAEVYTEQG